MPLPKKDRVHAPCILAEIVSERKWERRVGTRYVSIFYVELLQWSTPEYVHYMNVIILYSNNIIHTGYLRTYVRAYSGPLNTYHVLRSTIRMGYLVN